MDLIEDEQMTAEFDADNFDPPEYERMYFRHEKTGDLGYIVRRGGKDMIRMDRPNEELIRPMGQSWLPEKEARKMNRSQVAQVAFEADKRLCLFLGDGERARREWASLSDRERIAWMNRGPKSPLPRLRLYRSIMTALKDYALDE
jgi:hypothetical protein